MRHNSAAPLFRQLAAATMLAGAGLGASAAVGHAMVTPGIDGLGYGHRADKEDFARFGFIEQEFILSGQAQKYKGSGTLGPDGKWGATVVSNNTAYKTAISVRRPGDPAKFNGIVVVEWLNVSANLPLDVDWGMAREAFLREGYAYVGVNVQRAGILGVQKLKQYGSRYAPLSIPHDDISFDLFSQAAQAVRDQSDVILGGLKPVKLIASGHSQSAMRLVTYANAIQPIEKMFDGFMIHGRANVGIPMASGDKMPSLAALRDDTNAPIFLLQSETDVTVGSGTSKQLDSDRIRQWEVAGSAHADQYLLDDIGLVSDREKGWTPPKCLKPYNAMPFYMAEIAAFHHLKVWMVDGTPPPIAPRLQRDSSGAIMKDADGNALGGLRLPDIDVPLGKFGTSNFTRGSLAFLDLFACVAGGSTTFFAPAQLQARYPTHSDYALQYKNAADAALAKGFIRPIDHANAVKRAEAAKVP